jgi:hypothetical protein
MGGGVWARRPAGRLQQAGGQRLVHRVDRLLLAQAGDVTHGRQVDVAREERGGVEQGLRRLAKTGNRPRTASRTVSGMRSAPTLKSLNHRPSRWTSLPSSTRVLATSRTKNGLPLVCSCTARTIAAGTSSPNARLR